MRTEAAKAIRSAKRTEIGGLGFCADAGIARETASEPRPSGARRAPKSPPCDSTGSQRPTTSPANVNPASRTATAATKVSAGRKFRSLVPLAASLHLRPHASCQWLVRPGRATNSLGGPNETVQSPHRSGHRLKQAVLLRRDGEAFRGGSKAAPQGRQGEQGMRLPEPIERLLDPGPSWLPWNPNDDWTSVPRGAAGPLPVVELHHLPLQRWWLGPYQQDVPK
jgi:hypothetical protein